MTLPDLNFTTTAGLMAAAALCGSMWRQVWGVIQRLGDLVICRASMYEDTGKAVASWVWCRGRRSPFAVRMFGGSKTYVQPKKRVELVGYEMVSGAPMLFWFGWWPVVVKKGGRQTDETLWNSNDTSAPLSLWFIRGTLDLDTIVEEAVTAFNQLSGISADAPKRKRFNVHRITRTRSQPGESIYANAQSGGNSLPVKSPDADAEFFLRRIQSKELRLLTWTPDDLIERGNDAPPFDLYPYSAAPLAVLPRIDRWLKHETWFRSRGIPWRLGVLATGPTGTGKSTFVRSVAIKYDLPLYVFDLASLDNSSFADEWKKAQQNSPAIVLLEDLDCVFKGREFIAKVSEHRDVLTFDCLLNTISGVGSSDGILLFVTTNHVETLDSALGIPRNGHGRSSRPGRLDCVIEFPPTMEEGPRQQLAQFILSDYTDLIAPAVVEGVADTPAQFQERCAQVALTQWEAGHDPKDVAPPPVREGIPDEVGLSGANLIKHLQ